MTTTSRGDDIAISLGTLTALKLAERLGFGRAFAASLVLSCFVPLGAAALGLQGWMLAGWLAAVMLISAVGLGNANVYSLTRRQSVIPENQLARSAGAYTQVMYGSIPMGSALAGLIGETLGTRTGVLIRAAAMAISTGTDDDPAPTRPPPPHKERGILLPSLTGGRPTIGSVWPVPS